MSCSHTAGCKGTAGTQHLFAWLLQPHFSCLFYTERYFIHIHPHHTWDQGKPRHQHTCTHSRCCLLLLTAFFPVSNLMLFGIHSPFLLQVLLQKIQSWWQEPQLPHVLWGFCMGASVCGGQKPLHVHTPNLWKEAMEDGWASTSEMHCLGWCTVVERTILWQCSQGS